MDVLGIVQTIATVIDGGIDLWRWITGRRDTHVDYKDGHVVEGRITYLEGKLCGQLMLTFSYCAEGERFHKSWGDTLDGYRRSKLRAAVKRYSIGDTVSVWCARNNPDYCRIVDAR
jgi:hypothetical protein